MQIQNNINAMLDAQASLNTSANNISKITAPADTTTKQDNSFDLTKEITQQIPTQIAYEANAGVITMQNALQDTLLNIKA